MKNVDVIEQSMAFTFSGRTGEDSVSEPVKITNAKADTLEHFCFIVAAFGIPISIGNIKRVQDLLEPVSIGSNTRGKLRKIFKLSEEEPATEFLSAFGGAGRTHDREKYIFQMIGSGKSWRIFKHEGKLVHFIRSETFYGFGKKGFGSFEILPERLWQFLLFCFSDIFHCPHGLTSHMIFVNYDLCFWKTDVCDIPEMEIHIGDKVMDVVPGAKAPKVLYQVIFITIRKNIQHFPVLWIR